MHNGTRVVDHLVRAISALGVRHLFGVGGANIEDLYDAAHDHRRLLTAVVAKHEFAAATMADGYARSTSGLGVVAATSGGGAMNLLPGLAESYASRVPVLALIGQPPTVLEGKGAFQDTSGQAGAIDAVRLFTPVSHYCARVDAPADLPAHLTRAVLAARGDDPETGGHGGGPAILLLPKDIQRADLLAPDFAPPPRAHRPPAASLHRVTETLRAARALGHVLIIAGAQVARDDARAELAELARTLDAAVAVCPDAMDVYHHADPGFRGITGSMGHAQARAALESAALCLLIGTRLPLTDRAGLEDALDAVPLAGIGAEIPFLPSIHAHAADLAVTLADLSAALRPPVPVAVLAVGERPGSAAREPLSERASVGESTEPGPRTAVLSAREVPPATGPGLRYLQVIEAINSELPAGTDVFADAGNTGAAVVHHLRLPRGGRFTVALGMGGMGYAFGAGIGSAFARHRRGDGGLRRTVVIAGDGAFYMHGMEIHTAVEHRLPVTFVLLNNNAHAMCVTREQLYYRDRYSFNRFRPANPGAGLAAMFPDLCTRAPATPAELRAALRHCLGSPGPSCIAIECDPDEIPPFTPFLTAPRR